MSESEFIMRSPCRSCGNETGRIETKNGQDCVFCTSVGCGRFQYNAPKTETGRAPRTVSTVHNGIKPNQRARIIDRASNRCEFCGAPSSVSPLHVGHLVSVKDGFDLGLSDQEINHDENLAAMCDQCNLGLGDSTLSLRYILPRLAVILKARVHRNGGAA